MKISHILIASAALVAGPALAQDTATAQAGTDCASLQSQYDQIAASASSEQVSAAKAARDEGEKLCAEGKSAEGAAKLQEALSALSDSSQQPMDSQKPMEHSPIEQPPTDTQTPPQ